MTLHDGQSCHEIVFEDNGKFYQTTYSEGATEMQYESPWEYDDEVECTEVELREVKVKSGCCRRLNRKVVPNVHKTWDRGYGS